MKYRWILFSVLFLAVGMISSCDEEKVEPDDNNNTNKQLNESFYNLMTDMYLWYDQLPDVNPGDYQDVFALLDDIRYEEDRWSYIADYQSFVQYYQEGAYVGYGFGHGWDANDNLRITFVFDESPLKGAGVRRGWMINRVNGTSVSPDQNINELLGRDEPGVEASFVFESPDGEVIDTSFAKKELTMNTVLTDTVVDHAQKKVGYFVLKSFIDKTPQELTSVFRKFSGDNINELVIDLRYNGGGTLEGSRFLADFIISNSQVGQPFVKISHNDKNTQMDTTHVFQEDTVGVELGLDRVYFITTDATASSSEALINGLEPYLDVYLVGRDTYGKPVGMYAYSDDRQRYVFVPVCFSLENSEGVADYYDGLPVDVEARDDKTEPFASADESSFHQVLYHIENGSFDMTKAGYPEIPANRAEYRSLEDEIGAQ
jgi:C-terminal processing protease CtpA/Prc